MKLVKIETAEQCSAAYMCHGWNKAEYVETYSDGREIPVCGFCASFHVVHPQGENNEQL